MWEKIMEYQTTYCSPLGKICLTSDGEYLTGLWFADSSDSKQHLHKYPFKDLDIFKQTSNWLDIYFSGKNPNFDIKFRFENISPFQKEVYDILLKVKYGQVVTYNDIAKTIAKNRGITEKLLRKLLKSEALREFLPRLLEVQLDTILFL